MFPIRFFFWLWIFVVVLRIGLIYVWRKDRLPTPVFLGFPCGSAGKESACNAGVAKTRTLLSYFQFHFNICEALEHLDM